MSRSSRSPAVRALVALLAAVVIVALAGCAHFSGKYTAERPAGTGVSLEFKSGSKVAMSILGSTMETDYTVDGDKVTLKNVNTADLVLTEQKDGTLISPGGITFKKSN